MGKDRSQMLLTRHFLAHLSKNLSCDSLNSPRGEACLYLRLVNIAMLLCSPYQSHSLTTE